MSNFRLLCMDSFLCTAKDLWHPSLQGWPLRVRLEGDPDDPNTWHPVNTIKDHFGDIDMLTVVFADGTPEKAFNATDQVEFAVPRPS